jgi:hypothetical protein
MRRFVSRDLFSSGQMNTLDRPTIEVVILCLAGSCVIESMSTVAPVSWTKSVDLISVRRALNRSEDDQKKMVNTYLYVYLCSQFSIS